MFSATSKIICNTVRVGRVLQDVALLEKSQPASMIVRLKSACDEQPPKKCYTGRPKKRFVPDQDPKYEECRKTECSDYVPMDLQERKEYPPCRQKTWDDCPKPPKKIIRTCLTEKEKPKKVKCPVGMCCNEKDGKVKYSTYAPARRLLDTVVDAAKSGRKFLHSRSALESEMSEDPEYAEIPKEVRTPAVVRHRKLKSMERTLDKSFRVMPPIPSFSECARRTMPKLANTNDVFYNDCTTCLQTLKNKRRTE